MLDSAGAVIDKPEKGSSRPGPWRICCGAVATAYVILLVAPWQFSMPSSGLAPSWQMAITHAFISVWQWGSDVAFSLVPLGFLYTRPFVEGTLLLTFSYLILVAIAIAVNFLELVRAVPFVSACILFLIFAISLSYGPEA